MSNKIAFHTFNRDTAKDIALPGAWRALLWTYKQKFPHLKFHKQWKQYTVYNGNYIRMQAQNSQTEPEYRVGKQL